MTREKLRWMLTPTLMGLKEAQSHQKDILQECATWMDEGKLKIHLSQTFPLEEAATAHRVLETGSITGKIALLINE